MQNLESAREFGILAKLETYLASEDKSRNQGQIPTNPKGRDKSEKSVFLFLDNFHISIPFVLGHVIVTVADTVCHAYFWNIWKF